ncbi:transcriptional Coactivator p15-domain-containing protein [Chytriomyces cf. hyalinus JEL632]|nr:transcriptional Coactivator p15-domain-containing protein [Chytriomyces cf. hyalinus JEL632]
MAKRKDTNDDFIDDNDVEEVSPKKTAKTAAKSKAAAKKTKTTEEPATESTTATTSANDEKFHLLSEKKRAQVQEFKGVKFVNLREYYKDKDTGDWKPTKKGITLNKSELENLKKSIDDLIAAF